MKSVAATALLAVGATVAMSIDIEVDRKMCALTAIHQVSVAYPTATVKEATFSEPPKVARRPSLGVAFHALKVFIHMGGVPEKVGFVCMTSVGHQALVVDLGIRK